MLKLLIVSIFLACSLCQATYIDDYDKRMHPPTKKYNADTKMSRLEGTEEAEFWVQSAQESLMERLDIKQVQGQAQNVIFFLGDGMSVPTITAARILKGQKVDNLTFGEEAELYIDGFPNIGVSKTFCSDSQVADSACSATAYLCGSKGNIGTIGVSPKVLSKDCNFQGDADNHVHSILQWAQAAGKSTGIVTTTRVTHASPAGTYAHIAERDWENDRSVVADGGDPTICPDIAAQLILSDPGQNFNVILGGGRLQFLPNTERDPETNQTGYRADGQNLIQKWQDSKNTSKAVYLTGRDQLLAVNVAETDFLMGLFAPSHVGYLDEQARDNDPSLEEMTRVAIDILKKNPLGFFLFVEGGRIDHAHHDNFAQRALWETVEFDKAIKYADNVTNDDDTLIVVTSDHAHIMSIAGYPVRGNPIMGLSEISDIDNLPYQTLGYINGPGFRPHVNGIRPNLTDDDSENITYQQPTSIPLGSETHGGDDVLIFSKGPFSHLLTGIQQQSYIPHVIGYAACVGQGAKYCDSQTAATTPSTQSTSMQTNVPASSTEGSASSTEVTTNSKPIDDSGASILTASSIKSIISSLSITFLVLRQY